jgi:hypothetical protein
VEGAEHARATSAKPQATLETVSARIRQLYPGGGHPVTIPARQGPARLRTVFAKDCRLQ